MKHLYKVLKDEEKGSFILREFGEIDKDTMSLLCEQAYDGEVMSAAVEQGVAAVMTALRTPNIYPPGLYLETLAETVIRLYREGGDLEREVMFDDADYLAREQEDLELPEAPEEDSDLDKLLSDDESDDIDADLGESDVLPSITGDDSIKIADDESLDIEEEG